MVAQLADPDISNAIGLSLAVKDVSSSHHLMLLRRSTKPPWMQDAIDYFLENFVIEGDHLPDFVGEGSIEMFDISPAESGPGRTVIEVLDTLTAGLLVIRAASMQTTEGRRKRHISYREAMRDLRESISLYPNSRTLIVPIFLFALYEMIVSTTSTEKTWRIHLNGLLAMIHHSHSAKDKRTAAMDNVSAVRRFTLSEKTADLPAFLISQPSMDGIQKAWLLLDITKLRLRELVTIMNHFRAIDYTRNMMSFKKLDVEKLRVSIKRMQRDLRLVNDLIPKKHHPVKINATGCHCPSDLPPSYNGYYEESYSDSLICTKWNEYRTLILRIGDFQLRTG
ncbi:hypothetical protein TSTA_037490 [Talaromyces stipitatus ATCC 10500]|uniref:Uncharacterized protein n=1 Tax=Talaromyces stipitatus (strain ATCC 10500 / CBS 375.48 / QM 6759 / NRRL 1006) TaxID=441959 RepID=B8M8L6_TALSN|nr:uncharacterized protein TSTA_037490 [Talaromyces stipitatus ATCC 10500]EED20529.1 hypothetical protein TSTA_037490 [Talaromyces stipitatus ATCC 10500]